MPSEHCHPSVSAHRFILVSSGHKSSYFCKCAVSFYRSKLFLITRKYNSATTQKYIWNVWCIVSTYDKRNWYTFSRDKKGKRKVQGAPQSQAAVLPRHQEEEETRANQTNVQKKTLRLALSSPSEVIAMLKGLKNKIKKKKKENKKKQNKKKTTKKKHKNKITQGKT